MYVASTLNADNKAKGPVRAFVCIYAGKRKFVVKSEQYEETANAIRKSFDIGQDTPVTLWTSSLDVCRGKAVEIEEIAYPLLWQYIDEVAITTPEEMASTGPIPVQPAAARRKSRISVAAIARKSLALTPRLSDIHSLPSRRVSSSTISETPAVNDTQEEQVQEALAVEATLLDTATQEHFDDPSMEEDFFTEEPIKSSSAKGGPSIDNLFDDDVVEEVRPSRQQKREPSLPPTPSPQPRKPSSSTGVSTAEPRVKAERPAESKKKFKPKTESGSNARPREPSPVTAPRTKPAAPPMDENSRISIVITAPGDNVSAQFKMRGKHQMKKILKTACQNFDLDFRGAKLYLVDSEEEDENGEPVVTELPLNQTVLECGLQDGARLIVHVEEEEEEDDY